MVAMLCSLTLSLSVCLSVPLSVCLSFYFQFSQIVDSLTSTFWLQVINCVLISSVLINIYHRKPTLITSVKFYSRKLTINIVQRYVDKSMDTVSIRKHSCMTKTGSYTKRLFFDEKAFVNNNACAQTYSLERERTTHRFQCSGLLYVYTKVTCKLPLFFVCLYFDLFFFSFRDKMIRQI